jgi:hypothetical protein
VLPFVLFGRKLVNARRQMRRLFQKGSIRLSGVVLLEPRGINFLHINCGIFLLTGEDYICVPRTGQSSNLDLEPSRGFLDPGVWERSRIDWSAPSSSFSLYIVQRKTRRENMLDLIIILYSRIFNQNAMLILSWRFLRKAKRGLDLCGQT